MDDKVTQLENKVIKLEQDLQRITELYFKENFSDNQVFNKTIVFRKGITLDDGSSIKSGTSTGSTFGTASTEKIGFYGATPIVRPSAISQPSGGATVDSQARTAISSLITTIQNLGLTA